jgi:hypothetical protein
MEQVVWSRELSDKVVKIWQASGDKICNILYTYVHVCGSSIHYQDPANTTINAIP